MCSPVLGDGDELLLNRRAVCEDDPVCELHHLAHAKTECNHHVVTRQNRRAVRGGVRELGARSVRHLGCILTSDTAASIFP